MACCFKKPKDIVLNPHLTYSDFEIRSIEHTLRTALKLFLDGRVKDCLLIFMNSTDGHKWFPV